VVINQEIEMQALKRKAFEFNIQMVPIMEEASQPLQKYFGITHFCYIKFYNDGKIFRLGNNAAWTGTPWNSLALDNGLASSQIYLRFIR